MTWFRCGGSGIPAALKNRMNAVFNKKFGTAVDYPADGWPDDVNLMGPLPEATATGSIAHITDGADDVPTKSLVVTIPPTLSGVSSVTETQTGKNLLDTANAETKTNNSVSITCDGSGKYTATGMATGGSANITFDLKTPCTIKSGMYLHLMNASANASVSVTLQKQDNTTIYAPTLSPANRISDLSSYVGQTIYSIRFYVVNGATSEMTLTPMLCFSSTATTYEPYVTQTTYTASLGRTIYGGTADIVNGDGSETWGKKVYTGADNEYWVLSKSGDIYRYYVINDNVKQPTGRGVVYSSIGQYSATGNDVGTCFTYYSSGIQRVLIYYIPPQTIQTVEDFRTWLSSNNFDVVYEKATPTDFTFTGQEVNTRLGYNAFWSDSGDTEVTYRADISLALQAVSGSRGLMMASRPAIEPANGDQGSEESTENNIETEGDENAR